MKSKHNTLKMLLVTITIGAVLPQAISAASYSYMHKQCMAKFNGSTCTELGLYTIRKRGENIKGLQYLQRACKLDNARACVIVGNIFRDGEKACKDPFLAKKYYDKACRLGSSLSCKLYNNYRPYVVYTEKNLNDVIDEMFNGKKSTGKKSKNGCECKTTPAPKKECPDHSLPKG